VRQLLRPAGLSWFVYKTEHNVGVGLIRAGPVRNSTRAHAAWTISALSRRRLLTRRSCAASWAVSCSRPTTDSSTSSCVSGGERGRPPAPASPAPRELPVSRRPTNHSTCAPRTVLLEALPHHRDVVHGLADRYVIDNLRPGSSKSASGRVAVLIRQLRGLPLRQGRVCPMAAVPTLDAYLCAFRHGVEPLPPGRVSERRATRKRGTRSSDPATPADDPNPSGLDPIKRSTMGGTRPRESSEDIARL